MGSVITKDTENPSAHNLHKTLLRLAKTPIDTSAGADKSFGENSGEFPNVNDFTTPVKVKSSKTFQFSEEQTMIEIPTTTKEIRMRNSVQTRPG